jgi:hypothetical protein
VDLHHGGDAPQGPQLVREAMRPGALQQQFEQLVTLSLCQLVRPTRNRLGNQGRLAAECPRLPPLVY